MKDTKTVAGHPRLKNGVYHVALSYINSRRIKVTPSFSTGLKEKEIAEKQTHY